MKNGWVSYQRIFFISLIAVVFAVGCERPSPRPENVQITEVPNLEPIPIATAAPTVAPTNTPSTEEIEQAATAEAEAESDTSGISWPQSHEVIAGDTISRISIIYGVDAEEIIAANNLVNPDALEIGQVLTIPEPGSIDLTVTQTPAPEQSAEETEQPGDDTAVTEPTEQVYIVRAGDTLFRIALNFNTTVEALADYNDITNINALELGQEIRIPPSE